MKKYKDYKIYLFTGSVEVDPAFEKLDEMYVINMYDERIYNLQYNEFKKCIVLYDDFEAILDKKLKNQIMGILKGLLELSRKNEVVILTINHMTQNYKETRGTIFESTDFVLFPKFNINSATRFLKSYLDLSKSELEDIKKISEETRAITIHKSVPRYIIWEKGVWLI